MRKPRLPGIAAVLKRRFAGKVNLETMGPPEARLLLLYRAGAKKKKAQTLLPGPKSLNIVSN